jgi:competence protein ComEC
MRGRRVPQVRAAVDRLVAQQRENWPCWLVIGLVIGILLYFDQPTEAAIWMPVMLVAISSGAALVSLLVRRCRGLLWFVVPLLVISIGFTAGSLRTRGMQPHFLAEQMSGVMVVGRIAQVEPLPTGSRLTIDPAYLGKSAATPVAASHRLQITVLTITDDLQPGDWVRLRADLHPPSGPAAPGAFDFRRQAFFAGVDGVGFSYTARRMAPDAGQTAAPVKSWLGDWADRLRQQIAHRIVEILPDESGALAIALVVGNQTALRKTDMSAMRDSGLSHLLSISGLHISLAAGLMFVSCRFLLALFPWLALRIATKKWAAILALMGAVFYAILAGAAEPTLSGSVVPTQRSLIMAIIAFSAILLDRSPISLRLVAWSAVLLLLWQPDSLIGPSFQMSFAAVFALIAGFDALRPHLQTMRQYLASPPADIAGRFIGYAGYSFFWLFSMILSSLIASLATAPFGLYHFDRLQIYGIAANMLAVPLTGFWLMPAAVMALLLMPLGLDAPFWHLLGWGCDVILWIGRAVQHWPQAVVAVPAMPGWGLLAASAGLIWICLARGWIRLIGLSGMAAMMLSIMIQRQPDVLLSESGRLIAVQDGTGRLVVSSNRTERRIRETWLHQRAQVKSDSFAYLNGQANWLNCNYADDCRVQVAGHRIIFDLGRVPSDIACDAGDIIIVPQRRVYCDDSTDSKPIVIDQRQLTKNGAMAIYLRPGTVTPESIRIETAAQTIGHRPWSAFRQGDPGEENDGVADDGEPEAAQ